LVGSAQQFVVLMQSKQGKEEKEEEHSPGGGARFMVGQREVGPIGTCSW
jgi:hypothetical protein